MHSELFNGIMSIKYSWLSSMFIYEFTSLSTCLITRIVISGPYFTVYTSKKNCQEFNQVIEQLKMRSSIIGDHPLHFLCHTPFVAFSAQAGAIPHKHWQFSDEDRLKQLGTFFYAFLEKQSNSDLRKKDYQIFVDKLNVEREGFGLAEFPDDIIKLINSYDLETPFIPANEVEQALAAFAKYLQNTDHINLEKVGSQTEKLLNTHWDLIYNNHIILPGTELNKEQMLICDYFDSLVELREPLLALISMPNNQRYCLQLNKIIKKIRENQAYQTDDVQFHATIDAIAQKFHTQINNYKLAMYVITPLLSTTFLLYNSNPEDDLCEKLVKGILLYGVSILFSRCVQGPTITRYWNNTLSFFSNANKQEEMKLTNFLNVSHT